MDRRLPRYQQLHDSIVQRIVRGEWPGGQAIPTETELARSFEVAIGTVRKAVDLLEAEGLLERSQGRGTFVRRASFDRSLFRFFRLLGPDGERIEPESRLIERQRVRPPPDVADALRLGRGERALHLLRLRIARATPLLREEIWLSAVKFGGLMALPEAELGPLLYPVYEKHMGVVVAKAYETLTVQVAAREVAEQLKIAAEAPVVKIERLAVDHSNNPIELRSSFGPAATFRYQIEVS
jgi:GntR family transcriptional regulator